MEQFAQRIAADLEELQDRVNENNIFTDEFAYTFEKCFRGAAENYQQEKLKILHQLQKIYYSLWRSNII